jgi:hypothetical protein
MAVVGDQKEKSGSDNPLLPSDDDLRRMTGINEEQEEAHEREAYNAAAEDLAQREGLYHPLADENEDKSEVDGKSVAPSALGGLEAGSAASSEGEGDGGKTDGLYRQEKAKLTARVRSSLGGKGKGNKKLLLILGGFGGFSILGVLAVIFFLFAMFQIPDFATHIFEYQFAKVASEFQDSAEQATGQSFEVDTAPADAAAAGAEAAGAEAASETTFSSLASQFGSLSDGLFGKINQYRPNAIVDNLLSADNPNGINYVYEPTGKTFFGYQQEKLTQLDLDGTTIDVANPSALDKIMHPISSLKDQYQFSSDLDDALEASLDNTNTIIRGLVGREIRSRTDSQLYRWVRTGKKDDPTDPDNYDGVSPETAEGLNAEKSFDVANDIGGPDSLASAATSDEVDSQLADAEQKSISDEAESLETVAGRDTAVQTGQEAGDAIADVDDAVNTTALQSAAKTFGDINTVYAVALPLCIIYDGSLDNSKGTIDANSDALERTYYSVAAAGGQAQAGEQITSGANGALADQLGDTAESNPEIRAAGGTVNTATSGISPQAAAGGSFSLFNAAFGSSALAPLASIFNSTLEPLCPEITNAWGALAAGGIGLGLSFISGLTEAAGTAGVDAASTEALSAYIGKLITSFSVDGVLDEVKTFVAVGVGVAGLTELAKIVVAERAGMLNNGLAQGAIFANQVDAGGNIAANEYSREMFMGRPLLPAEAAAAETQGQQVVVAQNSSRSAYQRYLAFSNADSLVSKIGLTLHTNLNHEVFASVISDVTNIFNLRYVSSKVATLFDSKIAYADPPTTTDTQDYGIVQWGWSQSEENTMMTNPNYYPLVNEQTLEAIVICTERDPKPPHECIKSENAKQFVPEHWGECFGYAYNKAVATEASLNPSATVGSLLSSGKITRDDAGDVVNDPSAECSPINLGSNSPAASKQDCIAGCAALPDMIFRWRISMRNDNTYDHLLGLQKPSS